MPTNVPNYSDQRTYPRIMAPIFVDYLGGEVLLCQPVENISLGGICLAGVQPERIGTKVNLVFFRHDDNATLPAVGKIVWANSLSGNDVGIQFEEMDEPRKQLLQQWLSDG